jgi:hypothetical protein
VGSSPWAPSGDVVTGSWANLAVAPQCRQTSGRCWPSLGAHQFLAQCVVTASPIGPTRLLAVSFLGSRRCSCRRRVQSPSSLSTSRSLIGRFCLIAEGAVIQSDQQQTQSFGRSSQCFRTIAPVDQPGRALPRKHALGPRYRRERGLCRDKAQATLSYWFLGWVGTTLGHS